MNYRCEEGEKKVFLLAMYVLAMYVEDLQRILEMETRGSHPPVPRLFTLHTI
jgi:hypothetical protein